MHSVAITDHGAMYGEIEFYKEAKKQDIKPILGIEGYMANLPLSQKADRAKSQSYHILLLAENNEGYKNLMKLTSIAHLEGYYYRPRFDKEYLKKYSRGLICTSACPQGEVGQYLIADDYKKAKQTVEWFLDVFGENYYLEVQRHNYKNVISGITDAQLKAELIRLEENTEKYEKGIVKLSRDLGIPLVATNDAHYIKKEDAATQDALVCIATGKNVSDVKRLRYIDNPDFYIKTVEEMQKLYPDLPDALENTVKISEKCDVEITLGKWFFPEYKLPKGKTADETLREIACKRLEERLPDHGKLEKERLDSELDIISRKGYAPYFLIVKDLANWSNDAGIVTNTRGSAAGSLVSYVLGITTVNPIEYYLPFERFLNPYRPSPPDIDFDVADNRREEIIRHIADVYGHEKTAQICTFGRMLSRASVRDVARVLGYPYATGDKIAKMIPPPKQGFPITIDKALSEVPELNELYDKDTDTKKILDLARHIEGNARHLSVHAAGVVVSPTEITDFTPVQYEPSGDKLITQYEMHACEDVGLIKFDILGIRNLSILGSAIDLVKETRGEDIKLQTIPLNDKKTFEMLSRGETMGVFQLSGSGMTKFLKELKPEKVDDLMAMVALYRPGPISQIPEYISRKNNPKLVKYLDPRMEKFLDKSYGLIVYQDDLLFCALDLAGYTWEEADKFRKAVGKKIPEEMAAQKEKFTKGIVKNGQTQEFAEYLWKLFEPFQSYGFNKAHAASYGIVAYQTAYMKANYPVEYMCALLTAESNDTEKVASAIAECKRMKIKVLSPDINESSVGFAISEDDKSLDKKAIRFGFNAIKNVGKAAIDAILEERNKGMFLSFADFLGRVDTRKVNKKVLESLIKVGALQKFGGRAALLASVDEIRGKVTRSKNHINQDGLFADEELKTASSVDVGAYMKSVEEFSDEEIESLERQLLGFSLSAKPISELISAFEVLATHKIQDFNQNEFVSGDVKVAAVVAEVRTIITKKSGQEMAFVKVKDDTGSIELVVFPKVFQNTRSVWIDNKPLLITGKLDVRDDEPSLIVNKVDDNSDSFNGGSDRLYIKIPTDATADDLKKLRTLLMKAPGTQSVTLSFPGNRNMNLPFKIAWSKELARHISEIFHHSSDLH
jgi:DNA polymerase-3 subunit alpha